MSLAVSTAALAFSTLVFAFGITTLGKRPLTPNSDNSPRYSDTLLGSQPLPLIILLLLSSLSSFLALFATGVVAYKQSFPNDDTLGDPDALFGFVGVIGVLLTTDFIQLIRFTILSRSQPFLPRIVTFALFTASVTILTFNTSRIAMESRFGFKLTAISIGNKWLASSYFAASAIFHISSTIYTLVAILRAWKGVHHQRRGHLKQAMLLVLENMAISVVTSSLFITCIQVDRPTLWILSLAMTQVKAFHPALCLARLDSSASKRYMQENIQMARIGLPPGSIHTIPTFIIGSIPHSPHLTTVVPGDTSNIDLSTVIPPPTDSEERELNDSDDEQKSTQVDTV